MAGGYAPGDETIPGYHLVRFLGRGGFGEVWEASAPGGMRAALKMIQLMGRQGRKEFRAVKLVKNIRHPHLTPINGLWLRDRDGNILEEDAFVASDLHTTQAVSTGQWSTAPGHPAELVIAMGLGEKNLYDRLEECRREGKTGIEMDELIGYMEDAAKGIDYLNRPIHDLGSGPVAIQHCDIKPQNIMIVGNAAQVCDFGLAKALDDQSTRRSISVSAAYASPEVIRGRGPSHSTDQYSLAITFYELRCGQLPLPEEASIAEAMNLHLSGRLDFDLVSRAEQEVLRRATAVDPNQRFGSNKEFVRALSKAIEQNLETSQPDLKMNLREMPATQEYRVQPTVQESLEVPTDVGMGYRLMECLARSGRDQIWRAQPRVGRPVAVVLHDLATKKNQIDLQALQLCAHLEHPFLSELNAFWLLDDTGLPVTENLQAALNSGTHYRLVLVGKLSASNVLVRMQSYNAKSQMMPVEEIFTYLDPVAEALDYLNTQQHDIEGHRVGIQHSNVRPVNIVLDREGNVRLGNFSAVRAIEGDYRTIPQSGRPKHQFIAPEILSGHLSRWSDQYSLALTYLHLRLGTLPFDESTSTQELVSDIQQGQIDVSRLAQPEAEAVLRATQRQPDRRFPNCRTLIEALWKASREASGSHSRVVHRQAEVGGSTQYAPQVELDTSWISRLEPPPSGVGPLSEPNSSQAYRETAPNVSPSSTTTEDERRHRPPTQPPQKPPRTKPQDTTHLSDLLRLFLVLAIIVALAAIVALWSWTNIFEGELPGWKEIPPEKKREVEPAPPPPEPPPVVDPTVETRTFPPTVTNSLGMEFVLVPAGSFQMGARENDSEASETERPVHPVTISQPFYLAVHEVSVGQFAEFVRNTNYRTDAKADTQGGQGVERSRTDPFPYGRRYSWEEPGFGQSSDSPVVNVSWNDAVSFCRWLSRKEGVQYTLPTEAQWEYAYREGKRDTVYPHANQQEGLTEYGNVADASFNSHFPKLDHLPESDGFLFPTKRGEFKANAFGIHDLVGNVQEWCADRYQRDYYKSSPEVDPRGPSNTSHGRRVVRGGSWRDVTEHRCAYRQGYDSTYCSNGLGFRIVRELPKQ